LVADLDRLLTYLDRLVPIWIAWFLFGSLGCLFVVGAMDAVIVIVHIVTYKADAAQARG